MYLNKKQMISFVQLTEAIKEQGFRTFEVVQLLGYSDQLHKWFENYANGNIEVDESGNAFRVVEVGNDIKRYPIRNKKKEIERKIREIVDQRNATYKIQQDPRGCSLYVNGIPICL